MEDKCMNWTEMNWTELNRMHEWMIDLKCRKGQQQTKATCFCNAGQANFRASWNAWWEIVPMWISVLEAKQFNRYIYIYYIYMSINRFFTSVTLWCKFQPPQTHQRSWHSLALQGAVTLRDGFSKVWGLCWCRPSWHMGVVSIGPKRNPPKRFVLAQKNR